MLWNRNNKSCYCIELQSKSNLHFDSIIEMACSVENSISYKFSCNDNFSMCCLYYWFWIHVVELSNFFCKARLYFNFQFFKFIFFVKVLKIISFD